MCGISCLLKFCNQINDVPIVSLKDSFDYEKTMQMLSQRGPDFQGQHTVKFPAAEIEFRGYVLWQQGDVPCSQPVVKNNHVMLLNGDIYNKLGNPLLSDTQWLFEQLTMIDQSEDYNKILDMFRMVQGPYSLVYLNGNTKELFFIRDSLGRQTFLLGKNKEHLWLTSVVNNSSSDWKFIELPPLGMYRIKLDSKMECVDLFPWQAISNHEIYEHQIIDIQACLDIPVNVHKQCILPVWLGLPKDTFEWDFKNIVNGLTYSSPEELFKILLKHPGIEKCCDHLIGLIGDSIQARCSTTPHSCKKCINDELENKCNHPCVGILFSGGIDCTIIAIMADKYIDDEVPIDLLNVSFEKMNNIGAVSYDTPDRLSARLSLIELQNLRPKRKWNLIESNISRTELDTAMGLSIQALLYPLDTVLDADLGAALWFAARGRTLEPVPYTSPSRVLLAGSGADELFGGYARYRKVFTRNDSSWPLLAQEMNLDWVRLPSRNLARDDRVIGAQGVSVRVPYVDEYLTHFVRNLKPSQKCLPSLQQGLGDKLLLRLCAFRLGLGNVCSMPKRAIQFGSRIANSKQNGRDKMK